MHLNGQAVHSCTVAVGTLAGAKVRTIEGLSSDRSHPVQVAWIAEASYAGSIVATNLKVSGVSVFSAGDFMGGDGSETIVLSDINHGTYKKLVIAGGRLTGAVLVGDVGDALWYLELIRTRQPTQGIRADMMFGRSLAIRSEAA